LQRGTATFHHALDTNQTVNDAENCDWTIAASCLLVLVLVLLVLVLVVLVVLVLVLVRLRVLVVVLREKLLQGWRRTAALPLVIASWGSSPVLCPTAGTRTRCCC
jgi:hypothetical protein